MAEHAEPVTRHTARRRPGLVWRALGIEELGIFAALLLLCVGLAIARPRFLLADNLLGVARQASDYGIMAIGMVFLLAMGEIDLSVGSVLMLSNVVAALALRAGAPLPLAVAAGLATGAACGASNGLLSVLLRVPTIIVTLGTMYVFWGLGLAVSANKPVADFPAPVLDSPFFTVLGEDILGVPAGVVVMVLLAALAHVLLHHTPFGWRLMASGSNRQAARFSGIAIGRYRVLAMTLMGVVAAVAGVMSLAFSGSGDPQAGPGMEIFVIAAAIIGGTPLSGGSGSVIGAVLGALLIAVIGNGLAMLDVPPTWTKATTGGTIVAAVAVGTLLKRRA